MRKDWDPFAPARLPARVTKGAAVADAQKPHDAEYGDFTLGLEADYHSILRARPSQNSDEISEVAAGQQLKGYPGTYPSEDGDSGSWYYVEMDQGWKVDGYISADLVHVV